MVERSLSGVWVLLFLILLALLLGWYAPRPPGLSAGLAGSAGHASVDATWFDDISDFGASGPDLGRLRVAKTVTSSAPTSLVWKGQAFELRAGERIPKTGLRLASLTAGGVLLDNGGAFQWLPAGGRGALPPASPASVTSPEIDDRRSDPAARSVTRKYHRQLYRNMLSMVGAVQVLTTPETVGFTVFPGADEAGFYALGFKPGDRITGINGFVLADLEAALQVYGALTDAINFTLTVTRAGATHVILLSRGGDNKT